MKFAFYASNNATTLKKSLIFISDNFHDLLGNISFILIDNDYNFELRKITEELNIKLIELNLENKKKKNKYVSDYLNFLLKENNTDYLFIYCDKILKGELLKNYKNRIINFHPSLLPAFKGLNAIDKALKENAFILGNTAHFIDENIDEGIILMQSLLPVLYFKDYYDVIDMQVYMLVQLIIWIEEEKLIIENNKSYVKDSFYTPDFFIPNLENKILISEFKKWIKYKL